MHDAMKNPFSSLFSRPAPAKAVPACPSMDFQYTLLADGTAEITAYTSTSTDVTIPAMLDGHPVRSIGGLLFARSKVNSTQGQRAGLHLRQLTAH